MDKRPHVKMGTSGQGVQAQVIGGDGMPCVRFTSSGPSASGVQAGRAPGAGDATRAPFPWSGGKRRWAELIWSKLGDPGVYAEPFAGSLAVLLHRRQPCPREIVCDLDGLLANFWRALRADPEQVAYWAAWPTIHQDLTARHLWLRAWRSEHGHKVTADPDFYDAKVAGWWVWGLSNWIGGGWCTAKGIDPRPLVDMHGPGGRGVQAQRGGGDGMPTAQIPFIHNAGRAQGIQAQRFGEQGNAGHHAHTGDILDGSRWAPWFTALAKRLERVVVLNRSWESAVTPTLLQQTPSAPQPQVGIFLDPPYLTHDRDDTIYHGDAEADAVAQAAYEWATGWLNDDRPELGRRGDHYRIAYACGADHFEVPDGWHAETLSFAGIRDPERNAKQQDMVMFSPACVGQQVLF